MESKHPVYVCDDLLTKWFISSFPATLTVFLTLSICSSFSFLIPQFFLSFFLSSTLFFLSLTLFFLSFFNIILSFLLSSAIFFLSSFLQHYSFFFSIISFLLSSTLFFHSFLFLSFVPSSFLTFLYFCPSEILIKTVNVPGNID